MNSPKRPTRKSTRRPHKEAKSDQPSGIVLPRMMGEPSIYGDGFYSESHVRSFSKHMRRKPTHAESEFRRFLLSLNNGVLQDKFRTQHIISGDWILDFFIPEIRLGIEIDGSIHKNADQSKRDRQKERDCAQLDITLIRFSNAEVFGNKAHLQDKLRQGWRQALQRENHTIGKPGVPGRPTTLDN